MSRYFVFFLPAVVLYLTFLGWSAAAHDLLFVYAALGFIFIVIPCLDFVLVKNGIKNLDSSEESGRELVVVLLSLPVQIFNVFFFAWFVASYDLTPVELGLVVLMGGIFTALYAQNPAHELIHHSTKFERFVGLCLFSTSCYTGAKLAHVHSHHRLVATLLDPTSAKYGQSLYAFLPRAIAVNLFGWWGYDSSVASMYEFRKKIKLENCIGYCLSLLWISLIGFHFGSVSVICFLIQAFLGILILEMMNYIGHYGLERQIDDDRRMERVTARHAWDCELPFSNLVLIGVQKHADHHINPNKTFGELRCVEGSPRLPLSYPLLFLLTLIPPLWRAVIHPTLTAHLKSFQGEKLSSCGDSQDV